MPRLGYLFYTRSVPRLGRFLKGGYAPPFGAGWSKAAAARLGFDVLSGSVGECEAADWAGVECRVAGVGDAVVVDGEYQA